MIDEILTQHSHQSLEEKTMHKRMQALPILESTVSNMEDSNTNITSALREEIIPREQ
jgi:hypothetical protein